MKKIKKEKFKKELKMLINKYSIENLCDVPDFILADMVFAFMKTQGEQIKRTLTWHGVDDDEFDDTIERSE